MKKDERQEDVRLYLDKKILAEKQSIVEEYELFYEKYRINPVIRSFLYLGSEEYFFVILKYQGYGIYFNDIEEEFGVCRLNHNPIDEYAEFDGSLNGTVVRLNELMVDGNIDKVLSE